MRLGVRMQAAYGLHHQHCRHHTLPLLSASIGWGLTFDERAVVYCVVRVQDSGFKVRGSGFRVQGSGYRVQGAGSCEKPESGGSTGASTWVKGSWLRGEG